MTESAFADQPWLIERSGRFLQVTEMLYRVAELADGTRSVPEMARVLSTTLDADVSPEYVRRLIESKLVPIGIVAGNANPQVPSGVSPPSAVAPRSPLALQMRMALVSPRLVDPATRVLQFLYVPPVLLVVLFVTVQAQFWLFFVHGIASSVSEAFNAPGLVPVAFALLVASAAFHEIGHAAALRYGGGRVRSMGVGLYLMYPAFYTDVTDNYRLGRWARVRTDLGGFYFNLVFSLALMGVYHLIGHEFLLLVAVLIDLDIAHQCLPFVRLDGYWALADLTGIPDFFSLMGAYLRSVVPVPGWTGRKLPRLKWWAKAAFALYIGLALPAIALLLFAMLNATPRVLATAWETAQRQVAQVAQAQAVGDGLAVATAEAQLLLLLLPSFGLCLMLFNLSRALAHGLWQWGRPSPARRIVASVVAASAAAFLVMLWVPDLRPAASARVLDWAHGPSEAAASTAVEESAAPPTATPTSTPSVTPTVIPTDTPTAEPTASVAAAKPTTVEPAEDRAPADDRASAEDRAPAESPVEARPRVNRAPAAPPQSARPANPPVRASQPVLPPTAEPTEEPTPIVADSPTPRATDTPSSTTRATGQRATPSTSALAPSQASRSASPPPAAMTVSPATPASQSAPPAATSAPAAVPNQSPQPAGTSGAPAGGASQTAPPAATSAAPAPATNRTTAPSGSSASPAAVPNRAQPLASPTRP